MQDVVATCLSFLSDDGIVHLGLILGGMIIGVGFSSFYWSARWHSSDARLTRWEQRDAALKEAVIGWLANRPCVALKYPDNPDDVGAAFKEIEKR